MRKTAWATGLLAAILATASWCKPLEATASSFKGLVANTSEAIMSLEQSALTDVTPDMELVRRGIFECVYADNDTTSRDRVFIRGSDSCGFLDGSEPFEAKTRRIAGYVNQFLPGVHQPKKTFCYAVQFPADFKHRKIPLKDYIEQIDTIPLNKPEILHNQEWTETEETIKNQLKGELYLGDTLHKGESCDLLLIPEKQSFASNGAGQRIRGGLQSMVRGLGMIVWTKAGWVWSDFKTIVPDLFGNLLPILSSFLSILVTTQTRWDATTGKILYGDFSPNVTKEAGGLAGAWQYPIHKSVNGETAFTVGDFIMATASSSLCRSWVLPYYWYYFSGERSRLMKYLKASTGSLN